MAVSDDDARQGRTHRLRAVLIGISVFMAGPACLAGLAWYLWIAPSRHLADSSWLQTASPADLRSVAHRALRWGRGGHHDAFIILIDHGDAESVPLLIDALRAYPETTDLMSCSQGHCLSALRSLTGCNAGTNYRDWSAWWDSVGSRMPPESFRPRPARPSTRPTTTATRPSDGSESQ